MTVQEVIERRNIKEVLHFTTNNGLTGILDGKVVKPRIFLKDTDRLEYIVTYNCPDRNRDKDWHNYVNLSISSVNIHLFGISKGRWHSKTDNWWSIISFSPDILSHPGVYFTTTNNIYTGVRRNTGTVGLESLFASSITRWNGRTVYRTPTHSPSQPTCNQAEVLYPGDLSTEYLRCVYVESEDYAARGESIANVLYPNCEFIVAPELFG